MSSVGGQEPQDTQQQGQTPAAPASTNDQASLVEQELPQGDQFDRAYVEKLRNEAAGYRTKARDLESFMESSGGRERLERLVEATTTEEGVFSLFVEAGKKLGLGINELQSLFAGGAGDDEDEDDDDTDDKPLTRRELEQLLEQKLEQEVRRPLTQQRQEQAIAEGERAVVQTLDQLGVTDDDDRRLIMRLAEDFAPPDGDPRAYDPRVLAESIRKAHEHFETLQSRYGERYVQRKRQTTTNPLTGGGGGSPTMVLPKEPKNVQEAIDMIRHQQARQED